jgi:hypothetical protein
VTTSFSSVNINKHGACVSSNREEKLLALELLVQIIAWHVITDFDLAQAEMMGFEWGSGTKGTFSGLFSAERRLLRPICLPFLASLHPLSTVEDGVEWNLSIFDNNTLHHSARIFNSASL